MFFPKNFMQSIDLKTTQNHQKQSLEGVQKNVFLKDSAKLAEQQLCRSLSFKKVSGNPITGILQPTNGCI